MDAVVADAAGPGLDSPAATGRLSFESSSPVWSWSDGMFALHGMQPGDVVPTAELFLRHVHPDDRARVEQVLETCREGSGPAGCEYRLIDLAGTERTVTLAVEMGSTRCVRGLLVDVTGSRSRAVAREVDVQLARALESRAVIDQAKGVLMAVLGVDGATAFARMSAMSQQDNVRVRLIAEEILQSVAAQGEPSSHTLARFRTTNGTAPGLPRRTAGEGGSPQRRGHDPDLTGRRSGA